MDDDTKYLIGLTSDVAAQYFAKNTTSVEQIKSVVCALYDALKAATAEKLPETKPRPEPAVPIKKSVFPDYIVCLEDGKQCKMMKRHLAVVYNMTPAQYRERWGLPPDYPMVAPNYAERRSELAKTIGLGRNREPRPIAVVVDKPKRKKAA